MKVSEDESRALRSHALDSLRSRIRDFGLQPAIIQEHLLLGEAAMLVLGQVSPEFEPAKALIRIVIFDRIE